FHTGKGESRVLNIDWVPNKCVRGIYHVGSVIKSTLTTIGTKGTNLGKARIFGRYNSLLFVFGSIPHGKAGLFWAPMTPCPTGKNLPDIMPFIHLRACFASPTLGHK